MYVFASHGLFNADALFKIEHAKDITGVAVTNTIPLPPTYTGKKVRHHATASPTWILASMQSWHLIGDTGLAT